jgi:D-3-phosphoglycerate dehydrogenase
MKFTIANVDPQLHPADEHMRETFAEIDAEVIEKECSEEQDVIDFARDADAVLTARAPLTRNVVEKLSKCKVIGRFGAGTDNVDHEAATEKHIVVVYVPDFCIEEVSNHALMFILACAKKLIQLDRSVREGRWGFELLPPMAAIANQTLGLVGFGRIARVLARKVQPLGMKVLAHDPYVSQEVFEKYDVARVALEHLLRESDYVSLHTPLTEETKGLIWARQLGMMKPSAYLINCARGAVVDERALIDVLKNNAIAGAAVDCLDLEPPAPDNPLLSMENVILTPHSAAYSDAAIDFLRRKIVTQVADVLMGRKPEFVRNPDVLRKVKLST